MRLRPSRTAIVALLMAGAAVGNAPRAMAIGNIEASSDSYATVHDQALAVASPGVLSNDTDEFGNPQVVLDRDAAHGALTLGSDGSVDYTPSSGYVGPDSFTYHIEDVDESSAPVSSNVATATIDVSNADPVATDDSYSTQQGGTLTVGAATGVLHNDSDDDAGDTLAATLLTGVHHGTLTLNANGSFTYTPDGGFFGSDQFAYQADDGHGGSSDPATARISVNASGNTPPVATDDSYSTQQGGTLTVGAATGVLHNDSDDDAGDTLAATLLTGVHHGTLTLNANGSFTYTPDGGFFGSDQFAYQADDGHGGSSDPATARISVNASGNTPPVATDDSYSTQQGGTLTVGAATGVLHNDSDDDAGDTLAATLLTGVHHGTLTLNANGSFTYTPDGGFFGSDQFAYQADDGHGGSSDPATARISVNASGNTPPVATDDSYSTQQGGTLTVGAATGVLHNDSDDDAGDTLAATLLTGVHHGTLTLNANGSFTYTPDGGFFGSDQFAYQADDGHGGSSDPATARISVNASGNTPPVATDDSYSTQQGGTLTVGAATGVLHNDSDDDAGDTLAATLLTGVHHGTLTLNANGSFTYTPDGGFFGSDQFAYQADDGHGGSSDPATARISVNASGNTPPVATDDSYSTQQGGTLTVGAATGVLHNDSDDDAGDTLAATLLTGVHHGTLTLNANGSFTYTPDGGFFGSDQFAYQADDGHGGSSDPATARISVKRNGKPVAVADDYSAAPVAAGHPFTMGAANGVLKNDTDPDNDALTSAKTTNATRGSVTLNPDGSFTYRPYAGVCNATDTFTYRASDGILSSTPAIVTVRVRTPLKTTKLNVSRSRAVVTVGHAVVIRAHLGAFSKGAVVDVFARRPGHHPTLLGSRAPNQRTHNVTFKVKPIRGAVYFARSHDNCYRGITSNPRKVSVRAVAHGHMTGLIGKRAPTYSAYVRPAQPDGSVTFAWQRRTSRGWAGYFHAGVNLVNGHISVGLTSGVQRGVRYRVTLKWTAAGGNLPGAAPWTYFHIR